MKKLKLEIFLQIVGIGSASGLLHKDDALLLISDNAGYLYEYNIASESLSKTALFENSVMENIPKMHKADFEAIARHKDTIYIFGSGSTTNRNILITLNEASNEIVATHDLTDFYTVLKSFGNISDTDFNLEGAIFTGELWYFFQRGNTGSGKNGVFTVTGDITGYDFSVIYNEFRLPKIAGVETSFTDAILVDSTIYFLATAEKTTSAYDDGEVVGTILGQIQTDKMKVRNIGTISKTQKFEGIAFTGMTDGNFTFLLCEDNDSDTLHSTIYKLTVRK